MTTPDAVDRLLEEMTLAEKLGQMTQVEKGSITPEEVAVNGIGSVLSGGGGNPEPNTPAAWAAMVGEMTAAAAGSRLGIPLLYGVDAVHGHNNLRGATIFPHSIALGAAGDPDLVRRVARATAVETAATGVRWDFAPCVAVPQDLRWGRTYEGFGRDPELVAALGAAYVEGLQGGAGGSAAGDPAAVLACPKHYVGDGAAGWGTARRIPWNSWWDDWSEDWRIDQGDAQIDEETLRSVHLTPYRAAVEAGAATVMASYSSWRGEKMHGHRRLLSDVLRGELGFGGPVVSDWMGIDQLHPDYRTCVTVAVNAGVDMVMVPLDWRRFVDAATAAVAAGDIPMTRIDQAVRRVLRAKAALGLLGPEPLPAPALAEVGRDEHRSLGREAARRSAVLLRDSGALPIPAGASIVVGGDGADDIGLQCGGWTIEWQGARGPITHGTTLVGALTAARSGDVARPGADGDGTADVGILVASEDPYAEGMGDRGDLTLPLDEGLYQWMRGTCRRLVLVVYSGRPVVLPGFTESADAVVAAWLPGTEAAGIADVLLGRHPFEGRLPQPWPRSSDQSGDPLYPVGHG